MKKGVLLALVEFYDMTVQNFFEGLERYTFLEHNPIVEADIKMLRDDMEGIL